MTLDEAIVHCNEVAVKQEQMARGIDGVACRECAADHRQLAEWLTELKELRESSVPEEDYISLKYAFEDVKRLLKIAVEDMHIEDMCDVCMLRVGMSDNPIKCPDNANCFIWRYKQEAEELLARRN